MGLYIIDFFQKLSHMFDKPTYFQYVKNCLILFKLCVIIIMI